MRWLNQVFKSVDAKIFGSDAGGCLEELWSFVYPNWVVERSINSLMRAV